MRKFYSNSSEETIELAKRIYLALPKEINTILLDGNLSAGKTTFTKGIGKALKIDKIINSPTFTILKMYQGDRTLYHLDLYRLNQIGEDFDLSDYINDQESIVVIEWPYQVAELLPDKHVLVSINQIDENGRELVVKTIGFDSSWEVKI